MSFTQILQTLTFSCIFFILGSHRPSPFLLLFYFLLLFFPLSLFLSSPSLSPSLPLHLPHALFHFSPFFIFLLSLSPLLLYILSLKTKPFYILLNYHDPDMRYSDFANCPNVFLTATEKPASCLLTFQLSPYIQLSCRFNWELFCVCLSISCHWHFSEVQTSYFALSLSLGMSDVPIIKFKLDTLGRNVTKGMLYVPVHIRREVMILCGLVLVMLTLVTCFKWYLCGFSLKSYFFTL